MLRRENAWGVPRVSQAVEHQLLSRFLDDVQHNSLDIVYSPTSQAAQPELIDLAKGIWILPVVLDNIDIIGGCKETSEGRGMRIPERSRNDS
jgi:hypothetical protein